MKNRQIKFRIWDKTNKSFLQEMSNYYWHIPFSLTGKDEEPEGEANLCSISDILRYPDKFIIQQFTGLIDKNGKEIYEGDIVRLEYLNGIKEGNYIIKYWAACMQYVLDNQVKDREFFQDNLVTCLADKLYRADIVVIGNIFENPELI